MNGGCSNRNAPSSPVASRQLASGPAQTRVMNAVAASCVAGGASSNTALNQLHIGQKQCARGEYFCLPGDSSISKDVSR